MLFRRLQKEGNLLIQFVSAVFIFSAIGCRLICLYCVMLRHHLPAGEFQFANQQLLLFKVRCGKSGIPLVSHPESKLLPLKSNTNHAKQLICYYFAKQFQLNDISGSQRVTCFQEGFEDLVGKVPNINPYKANKRKKIMTIVQQVDQRLSCYATFGFHRVTNYSGRKSTTVYDFDIFTFD